MYVSQQRPAWGGGGGRRGRGESLERFDRRRSPVRFFLFLTRNTHYCLSSHESHAANGSGRHTAPVRAPAAVCSLRDIPAVSRQPAGPAQVCSDKSFISRQEEFTRLIEWNLSQTGAQACRVNRVRDSDAHPMQEAHKGAGDMPAMRPAKGDNAFLERVQERKEQVVLILSYTRTHARTYTYLASPATNMP